MDRGDHTVQVIIVILRCSSREHVQLLRMIFFMGVKLIKMTHKSSKEVDPN